MQRADAHVGARSSSKRREHVDAHASRRGARTSAPGSSDGATARAAGSIARSGVATITSAAPRAASETSAGCDARHAAADVVDGGIGRAAGDRDARSSPARAGRARSSCRRARDRSARACGCPASSLRPCPLFYASDGSDNVTAASRTPSHVASASTRSGATSRSGASTKPRSHMRGCGTVRSGLVDAHVVVRAARRRRACAVPSARRARAARPSSIAWRARAARADRDRCRSRRPRSGTRPAAGRRPARSRRRARPRRPRRRRRAASASTASCRCASAVAEVRPEREVGRALHPSFDAHADVVDPGLHRRVAACAPRRRRPARAGRRGTPRRCASRAARAAGSAPT